MATALSATIGSTRGRAEAAGQPRPILESLPALSPTIGSAIDGFVVLAEIFLPRAKRLAQATGARWPEEYERASVSHFERSLGVRLKLSK